MPSSEIKFKDAFDGVEGVHHPLCSRGAVRSSEKVQRARVRGGGGWHLAEDQVVELGAADRDVFDLLRFRHHFRALVQRYLILLRKMS